MNITSIAIQNTVLPELVSVQPMTSEYQALPILQFKYGTNKGEVAQGDVILDSTGAGYTNKDYDSKDVNNMPVATGVTSFLSPFTPIVPGTIKVVAGNTVITDDGQGNLSNNAGTVNYATGTVTFGSATAANTTISFEYDNSVIPNYLYPEIDDHNRQQVGDVTISIQPVEMRAYEHQRCLNLVISYRKTSLNTGRLNDNNN